MPGRNPAAFSAKGAEILASAIAASLALFKRILAIPNALVDMMERHATEK